MPVGHKRMRRAWKQAEEHWKNQAKRRKEEQRVYDAAKKKREQANGDK